MMCANTYVVICSVSQTSCNPSGTPKWESELSYKGRGRGTASAQPWPGLGGTVTGEGMKMKHN